MHETLINMLRGLALHYLHQGTVEQAIEQGKAGGLPVELSETFPGMMLVITSAAGAVFCGGRTFDSVVDEIEEQALACDRAVYFNKEEAAALVKLTLDFFAQLTGNDGANSPLPPMTVPWYQYGK